MAGYLLSRAVPSALRLMPLPIRRSMRGTSTLFASCPIAASGGDAPICLISEITSTGFGSGFRTSKVEGGDLLVASRVTDPLFIPQIAACVRFWTRILRRIALTWTFTVASAMAIFRAMHLLESPSIRQRRIDFSRVESCGASVYSVPTRIGWSFSSRGAAWPRRLPSGSRTNDKNAGGRNNDSNSLQFHDIVEYTTVYYVMDNTFD